ncbi:MAG: hypothetical protein GWN71_13790, partial [Gammaproteobacteria bacterium]|nr:hypothetical protein [Gemmatimonadota bacterium]NIT95453.1 hypothetical protein [Actinomycetota bacterium]NIU74605.1 hypothetical protein [Gammaproteobacteria bacterium]NIV55625.1 hypothetical protein [Actinomycetota bacterium]NIV87020.1 hypothetical protein [Actinomycetota bacterium]
STPAGVGVATRLRRRWSVATWQLVAAAALGAGLVIFAVWGWFRPDRRPSVARFTVALPATRSMVAAVGVTVAVSPDGSRFVYVGEGPQLYERTTDELGARAIPGTEGAHHPFFSPDGQWL